MIGFVVTILLISSSSSALSASLDGACPLNGSISGLEDALSIINGAQCSREYHDSLTELGKILSDQELLSDVCTQNAYQAIASYHSRFISNDGDKSEPIPKAIRDYFIGFASDVAVLCTRQLIKRFNNELKNSLFQIRQLDEFKIIKALALQHISGANKNEVNPKHISDLRIHEHSPRVHLVVGGSGEGNEISRVLDGCEVRYDLAFEELFKPVATLNALGYGVGLLSMPETMSLLSHQYVPWISAIDVCETLKDLDIIIDSQRSDVSEVSDEEASKLKSNLESLPKISKMKFDSVMPLDLAHESVQFKQITGPREIHNVVSKFETEVMRLHGQGKPSLGAAFDAYESSGTVFTTEKPHSALGNILSNFGF